MPLVFAFPWALLGLLALPALWWLLRVTPPPVRRLPFPAVRLLEGLVDREDKPHRIPPWLLALRLLAAALLIAAAAGPRWEPEPLLSGDGPLLLVIDNGWTAGPVWGRVRAEAEEAVRAARRLGRGVQILETAPARADAHERPPALRTAGDALKALESAAPRPWPADYPRAARRLAGVARGTDEILFLSSGLGGEGLSGLLEALDRVGRVSVRRPEAAETAPLAMPPSLRAEETTMEIRHARGAPATFRVALRDHDGARISAVDAAPDGPGRSVASARLPRDLLDSLGSAEIEDAPGAGSVQLAAEGNRPRRVLLWTDPAEGGEPQPLLSPLHYLTQAFSDFAEVARGRADALSSFVPDLVVTAGDEPLPAREAALLSDWTSEGGVLLRFAGDGLLREGASALSPVRLRPAVRSLGGALSWEEPVALAAEAPPGSPLAGLAAPSDLRVRRAVLAEPGPELESRTWAWLEDGSPFATADERGEGVLALVHTSADAEWSNVPISVFFPRMLRRLAELGRLSADAAPEAGGEAALEPFLLLDGLGRLGPPDRSLEISLPLAGLDEAVPSPGRPPGLYGEEGARFAFNLGGRAAPPEPLPRMPYGVFSSLLGAGSSVDLLPWALLVLLALVLVEMLAGLRMRGLLTLRPGGAPLAALAALLPGAAAALLALALAAPAAAQSGPLDDAQDSRIVYAITGVREVDETSYAALLTLTRVLASRTSVHLAEPFGVRPGVDDLSPYQMIYWPHAPGAPAPGEPQAEALARYIESGGMVLLDLRRDLFLSDAGFSAGEEEFLRALRLPPLRQVPRDYVLFRSFYLLERTPGRFDAAALWMSQPDPAADGVAPLFVGTNDWAAAWAIDAFGNPTHAIVPGGEAQREQAFRFGVNLVMHALSGSYKADQIHLKAIIERLQE